MTEETQSSFADDVWDVEQAGKTQNFIIGHEIVTAECARYVVDTLHGKNPILSNRLTACMRIQVSEP